MTDEVKMNKEKRKVYQKAWRQAHREEIKAYNRAHKEELKDYWKAYYQAHREEHKAYMKSYNKAHKDEKKDWEQAHKEERKAQMKAWYQEHKEDIKEYRNAYQKSYRKSDTNSLGQTKESIRRMSRCYLFNTLRHTKVEGYEIHHCFGYEDHRKFIYIPKELHLQIHQYLRDNGIDADSNHYAQIEHIIINYYKHNDKHILIL